MEGALGNAGINLDTGAAWAMRERVAQLAQHLMSRSSETGVRPAVYRPDLEWERDGARSFVTHVRASARESKQLWPRRFAGMAKTIHDEMGLGIASGAGQDATLTLPVRGLNIPLTDVSLREGDSVIVERPETQYVSVLGLVRSPGNFPYPLNTEHTLAEVLAMAGGLDLIADPRYVCLYRLKGDGTIASVTHELVDPENQEQFTEALAIKLRPGDVVSVEHTPRTRTNAFLDRVFRISLGLYFRPEELWE
jgi:hypothetical protein